MMKRRDFIKQYGIMGLALSPIVSGYRASAQALPDRHLMLIYKGNGFWKGNGADERFFPVRPGNGSIANTNLGRSATRFLNPYKDKLSILRGVRIDGGHHGATSAFTAGAAAKKQLTGGYKSPRIFSFNNAMGDELVREGRSVIPSLDMNMFVMGGSASRIAELGISYRGGAAPVNVSHRPIDIFNGLRSRIIAACDGNNAKLNKKMRLSKSLIDLNFNEYQAIKRSGKFSANELKKLEDYLETLRSVERKLASQIASGGNKPYCTGNVNSLGVRANANHNDNFEMFGDMMVFAHKWGITKISTFNMCPGANGRGKIDSFQEGYHVNTHRNTAKAYDDWFMSRMARLIGKINSATDVNGGNLLDKSAVVFGSEFEFGAYHNQPIGAPLLVIGKGSGYFRPQYYDFGRQKNEKNLVSMYSKYMGFKDHNKHYAGYGAALI